MPTKAEGLEAETKIHKAMSHPVRHKALRILNERVASPAEIARELGLELEEVAYHVKKLATLDCAELVDTRQVRGATEHFYRAIRRSLVSTEDWEGLPPASKGIACDEFMQAIVDDYGVSRRAGVVAETDRFHITRTPLVVDVSGRDRILEIVEAARLEIESEQAAAIDRMRESDEKPIPMSSSHACFEMPPAA